MNCPLCKVSGAEGQSLDHDPGYRVTCARCGTFEIEDMALEAYRRHPSASLDANRYLLMGRARTESDRGRTTRFTMAHFGEAEDDQLRHPELQEKIVMMLRWFKLKSTSFGERIRPVSATDYPAAYCRHEGEWTALIHGLAEEGALKANTGQEYSLTLEGEKRLTQADETKGARRLDVKEIPSHFDDLLPDVERFHRDGPFETSVFVMMKFPDGMPSAQATMLKEISSIVKDELSRYGLTARLASDKNYRSHIRAALSVL